MKLYISKWWGDYVGGTDDSLLLLDYLETRESTILSLREIMYELNLTLALESKDWENVTLSWKVNDSFQPDFDLVIDVVIDLSAIIIEVLKNKTINLSLLDSSYKKKLTITIDKNSVSLLTQALDYFITHSAPDYCGYSAVISAAELQELMMACKEIYNELKSYL